MTATVWIRLALLASVSGCTPVSAVIDSGSTDQTDDTDPVLPTPCEADELPTLTGESDYTGAGRYVVCADAPASGTCPLAEEAARFVAQAAGPLEDPEFCGWAVSDVCGPFSVSDEDCCYVAALEVICEGRPLTIDETARTAETAARADWRTLGQDLDAIPDPIRALALPSWQRAALAEHASIASFARFTLELLALGAPADLVRDATQAQADEIDHARQAFAVVHALSGHPTGPGSLPVDGVTLRTDPAAFLRATLLEGCVNESIAAAQAKQAAEHCTTPSLRALLDQIAIDEARHAALGWRTVAWLLSVHPHLREVAAQVVAQVLTSRPPAAESDPRPAADWYLAGLLPPDVSRRLTYTVRQEVVRPVAEAVIGTLTDRCAEA